MSKFKETIIIAMGGSLLIPDNIDIAFIKDLKDLIGYFTNKGYQIILVVGGGKTCRRYQSAARKFSHVNDNDLDWIGIKTIRLNCELLFRIFSDLDIYKEVIEQWKDVCSISNSLVIIGAYKPGCSSDTDAVEMARFFGSTRVINFSNISHVYNVDPHTHHDATKFEHLSWNEYRRLIPKEWTPGMSTPFDPVAAHIAEESNITVVILGASIQNLQKYLSGYSFEGTIIS